MHCKFIPWIIFGVWLVFAVIGGCLMGLAPVTNFTNPQFIVGFVFIMIDAIVFTMAAGFWLIKDCL